MHCGSELNDDWCARSKFAVDMQFNIVRQCIDRIVENRCTLIKPGQNATVSSGEKKPVCYVQNSTSTSVAWIFDDGHPNHRLDLIRMYENSCLVLADRGKRFELDDLRIFVSPDNAEPLDLKPIEMYTREFLDNAIAYPLNPKRLKNFLDKFR